MKKFNEYFLNEEAESSIDDLTEETVDGSEEETFDDTFDDTFENEEESETETVAETDAEDDIDLSIGNIRGKMKMINSYVGGLKDLIDNAEDEPLDKATKKKVIDMYNVIQGIK